MLEAKGIGNRDLGANPTYPLGNVSAVSAKKLHNDSTLMYLKISFKHMVSLISRQQTSC